MYPYRDHNNLIPINILAHSKRMLHISKWMTPRQLRPAIMFRERPNSNEGKDKIHITRGCNWVKLNIKLLHTKCMFILIQER